MDDVQLTPWFYLSFAGDRDGVDTFFGACIVEAPEMTLATMASHALGINPGGEVMGMPIPEGFLPGPEYRERLLTKKEIKAFWPDADSEGDRKRRRESASENGSEAPK